MGKCRRFSCPSCGFGPGGETTGGTPAPFRCADCRHDWPPRNRWANQRPAHGPPLGFVEVHDLTLASALNACTGLLERHLAERALAAARIWADHADVLIKAGKVPWFLDARRSA